MHYLQLKIFQHLICKLNICKNRYNAINIHEQMLQSLNSVLLFYSKHSKMGIIIKMKIAHI